MTSRRQRRLEALVARLQVIQTSGGFQTDAGAAVFLGDTPNLGPDDPDSALVVVPGDTQPGANRMEVLPVEIQGVAKADLDRPYLAVEAMLSDVAESIELEDRTLGGLIKSMELGAARALPREDGSTVVGVGQTYLLSYIREWGAP